jgi:hypothetical protein
MRLNPEFRRYLWLELSLVRFVGMPLVLGGIFFLDAIGFHEAAEPFGGADMYEAITGGALVVIAAIVLFWGTRLAAGSLVQEVADKTWDAQRLSSLGPWAMTWGKLWGSTVYVWYGIVLSLAVAVVAMAIWNGIDGSVARLYGARVAIVILQVVIGVTAFAALIQATALVVALTALHNREASRRFDITFAQFAALVVALLTWSMVDDVGDGRTEWFGYRFDGAWFAVASLGSFALWSVIGVWRRMQLELQVRIRPWLWPIFVIFVALWVAGFAWPGGRGETLDVLVPVVLATLIVVFASYVPALFERLDPVRLRHLIAALRAGRLGEAIADAPLWIVNHGVALVAVAAAAVYILALPVQPAAKLPFGLWDKSATLGTVAGTVVAIFLFVTRDLLLLTFAYLGRTTRRALTGWVLWLAVLYVLIPAILAALGFYAALPAFVPVWDVPFVDLAVPPVVWPVIHIAVVSVLLGLRWRRFATERIAGAAQAP